MYEILKAGDSPPALNFDAKVRRQSTDKYDMFYGHIGAMDVMALSLKLAARMIEDGKLDRVWQNAMPAGRASWGKNYERADVAG